MNESIRAIKDGVGDIIEACVGNGDDGEFGANLNVLLCEAALDVMNNVQEAKR